MSIYTDFISDHELIKCAHPSHDRARADHPQTVSDRVSEAVYADGTTIYWRVGSASQNRIYAREYGARIINSPLISCRWMKEVGK